MVGLFVRYHLRPAIRDFTAAVTPLTVIGALAIVALFATGYGSYFAAVRQGVVPVEISPPHLRAVTLELVVAFLVAGLRKRQGLVTFCSSTAVRPADALRLILMTNAGKPFGVGVVLIAFVLPFVLRLSPSIERSVLHVASDAVAVVLHYLAAALIAALWHRSRKGGAYAAVTFVALMSVELLVFRQWPELDLLLLAVNIAACVVCWTVVFGRLDAAHVQRFLISAVPRRGGRSMLSRLLRPLPVEAKLYVKGFLIRRESAMSVLIAVALFTGLIVALIIGIPGEARTATIIACTYAAAVFATSVLGGFDRGNLVFCKTTSVTFGRLTVSMLAPHCAGYLLAAAIAGVLGVTGGMGFGSLLVLLSQGVFLALVMWLIPFRFLYSSKLFVLLVSGLIVAAGFVLAVAAGSVQGTGSPVVYAGFVLLIPAILYPGASFKYQGSTVEDWVPAT